MANQKLFPRNSIANVYASVESQATPTWYAQYLFWFSVHFYRLRYSSIFFCLFRSALLHCRAVSLSDTHTHAHSLSTQYPSLRWTSNNFLKWMNMHTENNPNNNRKLQIKLAFHFSYLCIKWIFGSTVCACRTQFHSPHFSSPSYFATFRFLCQKFIASRLITIENTLFICYAHLMQNFSGFVDLCKMFRYSLLNFPLIFFICESTSTSVAPPSSSILCVCVCWVHYVRSFGVFKQVIKNFTKITFASKFKSMKYALLQLEIFKIAPFLVPKFVYLSRWYSTQLHATCPYCKGFCVSNFNEWRKTKFSACFRFLLLQLRNLFSELFTDKFLIDWNLNNGYVRKWVKKKKQFTSYFWLNNISKYIY